MFEQLLLMAFGELQQTVMLQNDHICRLETRIDKLCNNKQGDVIEAGGMKNITYNNYYGTNNHQVSEPYCELQVLPKELNTEKAQIIKEKMVSAVQKGTDPFCTKNHRYHKYLLTLYASVKGTSLC